MQAPIADMRDTLAPLGQHDLQVVGSAANQEFIARMEARADDPGFQTPTEERS